MVEEEPCSPVHRIRSAISAHFRKFSPADTIKKELLRLGVKEWDDLSYVQKVDIVRQAFPQNGWVIFPTSRASYRWDFLLGFILLYTLIVTPFEVAFTSPTIGVIFILNRIADVAFLGDMFVSLFRAYRTVNPTVHGLSSYWETDLRKIRWHYLKSAFLLDVATMASSCLEIVAVSLLTFDWSHFQFFRTFRTLRAVRLIRITALVKVVQLLDRVCDLVEIGFLGAELLRVLFCLLAVAHFMACLWGLTANLCEAQGLRSWMQALEASTGIEAARDDPGLQYLFSLYWALVTLTSTGYGDIVPRNVPEFAVSLILVLVGSSMWIYTTSVVIQVVGVMDSGRYEQGRMMSAMVELCHEYHVSDELKEQLKSFVSRSQRLRKLDSFEMVFGKLSPSLRTQIEFSSRSHYIQRIRWTLACEDGFLQVLTKALQMMFFSPNEWIVPDYQSPFVTMTKHPQLNKRSNSRNRDLMTRILTRHMSSFAEFSSREVQKSKQSLATPGPSGGIFMRGELRVYIPSLTILEKGLALLQLSCSHTCWHEDIILSQPALRDREVARSLSFCSVHMLARADIFQALRTGHFPHAAASIRWAAVKLAMVRIAQQAANAVAQSGEHLPLSQVIEQLVGRWQGQREAEAQADSSWPRHSNQQSHRVAARLESIESSLAENNRRLSGIEAMLAGLEAKLPALPKSQPCVSPEEVFLEGVAVHL